MIKCLRIYRKAKIKNGVKNFLVNGNTIVYLENNVQITNNGSFNFGLTSKSFPSLEKQPCKLQMKKDSKIIISGSVRAEPGVTIRVGKGAVLEFGGKINLTANSSIICEKQISFGNHVKIGWESQIMDSDFHSLVREGYMKTLPIHVGNDVWIGNRVSILKGVTIGDGSVVAAGAVVNRDVPAHSLVAGVPARLVRSDVKWVT